MGLPFVVVWLLQCITKHASAPSVSSGGRRLCRDSGPEMGETAIDALLAATSARRAIE